MQPDHSIGFRAKLTMRIESNQPTETATETAQDLTMS